MSTCAPSPNTTPFGLMKKKFGLLPDTGCSDKTPLMLLGLDPLTRVITLLKLSAVVNTAASPVPTPKVSKLWNRFAPALRPIVCGIRYRLPGTLRVAPELDWNAVALALGTSVCGVLPQLASVRIAVGGEELAAYALAVPRIGKVSAAWTTQARNTLGSGLTVWLVVVYILAPSLMAFLVLVRVFNCS